MALSKYTTRESAADALLLLKELARRLETLKSRVKWSDELEKALEEVKKALTR
jgi:Tfp pilus assembly protein PilF